MKIQVKLTGKTVTADVIKENPLTVWVKLDDGNVIKRNKRKHVVK